MTDSTLNQWYECAGINYPLLLLLLIEI